MQASSREHKLFAEYIMTRSVYPFSASLHSPSPNLVVAEKMTTQPVSHSSASPVGSNSPTQCVDGDSKVVLIRKPSPRQDRQGDLPDLMSLQIIASDPETACGIPVPQTVGVEAARNESVGDAAPAPAPAPHCTSNTDAGLSAPNPRYRPAYELADGAHERLGRATHPPVLKS